MPGINLPINEDDVFGCVALWPSVV
eukprot:COSAG05_NODE_10737_length_549_cov_0.680000_1_plen_24_part_01